VLCVGGTAPVPHANPSPSVLAATDAKVGGPDPPTVTHARARTARLHARRVTTPTISGTRRDRRVRFDLAAASTETGPGHRFCHPCLAGTKAARGREDLGRHSLTHPRPFAGKLQKRKHTRETARPAGRRQAGRQAKVASQRNGAPELGSVPPLQFPVPSVARSLPFPCFLPPPP
jgi:hypothetical protein